MSETALVDGDKQLLEVVSNLQSRIEDLEERNCQLEERVDELEAEREQEAALTWRSEEIEDLKLVHPEMGFEYPLGLTVSNKLSPDDFDSKYDITLESLVEDVQRLKRGEVDTTDLVGGVDPELPIEEDLAKANDETRRTELSTNELRAVHVFRKFGAESKSWSGMMTLDSADVRRILEDEGETDLNDNDPRRTMRMLAKKSADVPKEERGPKREDNLFTLAKGDKRLELRVDKGEFVEYWQGMEERYSP